VVSSTEQIIHPVAVAKSAGHVFFAVTLIGLGVLGLSRGHFAPVWQGIPDDVPAREPLAYLGSLVYLACGCGLLWQRTAAIAARVLFAWLLLWMLLFKVPIIVGAPTVEVSYQECGQSAVLVAAAWVIYVWLAADWDRRRLGFIVGTSGLRGARLLYGLALVAFGLSHFAYLQLTAPIVPQWLSWPVFWAYFTGATYLAAAAAILTGRCARLAAALAALQIGLFTLLVWPPILAAGASEFRWNEFVISWWLTAAAWLVADSYRGTPWIALTRRTLKLRAEARVEGST
jgi:uncharacterized membrane protein